VDQTNDKNMYVTKKYGVTTHIVLKLNIGSDKKDSY